MSTDLQPLTEEDLQQIAWFVEWGLAPRGTSIAAWERRMLRRLLAEVRRFKAIEASYLRYCDAQAEATIAMSPDLQGSVPKDSAREAR